MKMFMITSGVTSEFCWIFLYVNNVHLVALHVFHVHHVFLCYFQAQLFGKVWCCADAFYWFSCCNDFAAPPICHLNCLSSCLLIMVNSWKHSCEILKSNQKVIICTKLHYFEKVIEIGTLQLDSVGRSIQIFK